MASRSPSRSRARPEPVALAAGVLATAILLVLSGGAAAATSPQPAAVAGARVYSLSDLDLPTGGGAAADNTAAQQQYLEVFFGERSTGQYLQVRLGDGRLHANADAVRGLGIVLPDGIAIDTDGSIALDALPGLAYHYDPAAQTLVLDVPTQLRPRQQLGYVTPDAVVAHRDSGLLFNYDAYARSFDGTHTVSAATLLRGFGRFGAIEQSGVSRAGDDAEAYQRLDTRWIYSDPVHMSTWVAGDLINGGLAWSTPVRMGGVQWRRNFAVRPDLITFPVPQFGGEAALPSAVQVLVNNVQQFSGEVEDGPFVVGAFPRISGAGEATLIVRDALGRLTETSVPIYTDYERLARGLSDYSLEAGSLRRGYATDDDRYDHAFAASGSYRRGLSDSFTLEAHGEYGDDLRLAGVGGVWSPAGHWGLVSASIARSDGMGSGSQRSYGYQWTGPWFGFDAQVQRRSTGFRDLGVLADNGTIAPVRLLAQDRMSLWTPLPGGSLAYSWVHTRDSAGLSERVQTLSWTQMLGHRVYLTASAFDGSHSARGLGLSLSVPLDGNRDASLVVNHSDGENDVVAGVHQAPDYDGGWGWDVQAGDRQGGFGSAAVTLRGARGEATVGADHVNGLTGVFAQATGSLVRMADTVFASRRVGDSFAVVSSNGVPGVPVLYENRVYGRTDDHGLLLLPDLRGWQHNRVAIDPDTLPADYRVPALEQQVTPADAGAVLVRFDVARVRPAMVALRDRDGAPVAAGTSGHASGGAAFLVGLDGEAYIDDLQPGSELVTDGDAGCRYRPDDASAGASAAPGVAAAGMLEIGPLRCEEIR